MKKQILFFVLLLVLACKQETKLNQSHNKIVRESTLLGQFMYDSQSNPLISVHRGGKGLVNYPENCLETMQYVHSIIPDAIFEIDISQTKDSILVLMHDNSLDRTTTGTGLIKNKTFKELQNLRLQDDFNNLTSYSIPLFEDVLKWALKNRVVLTIDIKKSVYPKYIINTINKFEAQDVSIIITYDLKQAQHIHALAPNLLLSVSARNNKEFEALLDSNIPTKNMLAFTGTRLSSATLYDKIHSHGIKTILGTLGNLDNRAKARGDYLYNDWVLKGIDIIATDRPFQVYNVIK